LLIHRLAAEGDMPAHDGNGQGYAIPRE